jgi:hypothetical protein
MRWTIHDIEMPMLVAQIRRARDLPVAVGPPNSDLLDEHKGTGDVQSTYF